MKSLHNACKLLIYILIVVSPFLFYSNILDYRLIVVPSFLVAIIIFLGLSRRVSLQSVNTLYLLILIYLGCCGLLTGDYNTFLAAFIFGLLISYPYLVNTKVRQNISIESLKKAYILGAILSAIGTYCQYLLFKIDIHILRIIEFGGGRTAFSFLWEDFSFLSLYLMSACPLIISLQKNIFLKIFAIGLLTGASIITSARTGIASAMITLILFLLLETLKQFQRNKLKKNLAIALTTILVCPPIILYTMNAIGVREISTSDSGRFQGYLSAWSEYSKGDLLFGEKFKINEFSSNIDIIPHNLFLYMLTFGGVTFLTLFLAWFFSIINLFKRSPNEIFYSFLIIFIGTMFIPSFFSTYFLANLIVIAIFHDLKKTK